MFVFSFSSKYTITSEGLVSTYINNRSSFDKWEDIMEFKFVGNRKGKYTDIDEKGIIYMIKLRVLQLKS